MTVATETTDYPEALVTPGFSSESVEAVADFCEDPDWLREVRRAAWETFTRIPMPSSRDEKWRFTNMRRVSLDGVKPFSGCDGQEAALERAGRSIARSATPAARFVSVNNAMWDGTVTVGDLPEGVVVSTFSDVMGSEHEELLRKHLGTAVPVNEHVDDKFVALNTASFSGGVFVYVPRNTRVEQPIEYSVVHAVDEASIAPRVLVVLEEGAEATFVEEYLSVDDETKAFSNAVVELVVGQAAKLTYITAQDYAAPVTHFATHRVLAGRDAQVEWTAVGLGASLGKSRMEARMIGPGASVRLNGLYILDGKRELDYDTQQFHEAPNAFSDLAFKGVLSDRAKSVWRGMIVVEPGAQGTDSYQENRNLLLSKGAHADSIPGLQIEANEVRCTHGATLSRVDQEQLFYLLSRGISREEATRTIVRGFFTPLLDRVQPEPVRDQIRDALWARLERPTRDLAG